MALVCLNRSSAQTIMKGVRDSTPNLSEKINFAFKSNIQGGTRQKVENLGPIVPTMVQSECLWSRCLSVDIFLFRQAILVPGTTFASCGNVF